MRKTKIIAEAGVNHNGSLDLAYKLVDEAIKAGADTVKFQTAIPELVMSSAAPKAEYQNKTTSEAESQLEMCRKIHLKFEDYVKLLDYCRNKDIEFLSTPFDHPSIDFLFNELKLKTFKIPSGEITNKPYLEHIGSLNTEIILSTGMATLGEIESALQILVNAGSGPDKITVLHCNTDYPTPMEDVNLRAMLTVGKSFGVKYGYSDHTQGLEIPIAAVALGATVIEKHFTLDKSMEGPDHKASLGPTELTEMVKNIRNVEKALGSGIKQPSPSETKNIPIARRSIHLVENFEAGHVLERNDLVMKRPGDGISPMKIDYVVGRALKEDKKADEMLKWSDL